MSDDDDDDDSSMSVGGSSSMDADAGYGDDNKDVSVSIDFLFFFLRLKLSHLLFWKLVTRIDLPFKLTFSKSLFYGIGSWFQITFWWSLGIYLAAFL